MARLKSKLIIEGTLDGLSFYRTQDGIIVRRKWGPDKKRLKRDPAFSAVAKHGKDFGQAARQSAYVRGMLLGFLKNVYDNRVIGRLNELMLSVIKLDEEGAPGNRDVDKAFADARSAQLLSGFEFNIHCPLKDHLLKLPKLSKRKGRLYLTGSLGSKDLKYPKGATHAGISIGWLSCNFASRNCQLERSEELFIAQRSVAKTIKLCTTGTMNPVGCSFYILKLSFYKKTIFGMEEVARGSQAAALVVL